MSLSVVRKLSIQSDLLLLLKPWLCDCLLYAAEIPQIPIDFDKEGCGISVPYYDAAGWINTIEYIPSSHPDEAN